MARSLLYSGLFIGLLAAGCSSTSSSSVPPSEQAVAAIVEREHQLVGFLVRALPDSVRGSGGWRGMIAPGFTCATHVPAEDGSAAKTISARHRLCTGLGHELPNRGMQPEWIVNAERTVPRSAAIENLEVTLDNDTATAVSTQIYRNWFPYDGSLERRSRVTDTWVWTDGEWLLQRRVSVPLRSGANS